MNMFILPFAVLEVLTEVISDQLLLEMQRKYYKIPEESQTTLENFWLLNREKKYKRLKFPRFEKNRNQSRSIFSR